MSRLSTPMGYHGWTISRDGRKWKAERGEYSKTLPTALQLQEWIHARNEINEVAAAHIMALVTLIEGAHDTHIWSDDDEHPAEGCDYCIATRDMRELLGNTEEITRE